MSNYAAADNHNNSAGLTTLSPQPATPDGIRYYETIYDGAGGASYNGYRYAVLVWDDALEYADRNTIMTAFGLSDTVASNEVTVRLLENDGTTWTAYNATASYEQDARRQYWWSGFRIRLNRLEPSS